MTTPAQDPAQPTSFPSNDDRPNSGLREGGITHAEVNEALRLADKRVIFGQQTRLRLGLLMEDDSLRRYHAGHDLVKFFYGAIRQIPEALLDAILAAGISVTLVTGRDLLAFRDVRAHQSFHTGRTRRTIYMPEQIVESAFRKGYDYWALSEVIIQEAWPLLDYILILELVRRVQVKLRQVLLPGISFIKDTLRGLNKHRLDPSETLRAEGRVTVDPKDDEFMLFYGTYAAKFLAWDRRLLERDPYDVADEVFDEGVERQWAAWKVDAITHTFSFPTYFALDRDIVHPAAYDLAARYGQATAPATVDQIVHDLGDAARFRLGRQVKTEPLLDQLIDLGAPGIRAFAEACATERAAQRLVITDHYYDGYDSVARFRKKLQDWSSDLPPELGVGHTFDDLRNLLVVAHIQDEMQRFRALPEVDQGEWRLFLRDLVYRLIGIYRPYVDEAEKERMLTTPAYYTPAQQVDAWCELARSLLPADDVKRCNALLVAILRQLRRHREFHGLFLTQARALSGTPDIDFGADRRQQIARLEELIPEQAYRTSSDPQALYRRLEAFRRLRRDEPDSQELLPLVAGIFVRLDGAPNYAELIDVVRRLGDAAQPPLEEIVEAIGVGDERRATIRQTAMTLLEGIGDG